MITTEQPRPHATLDDARCTLEHFFGYPDFRAPQKPAIEAVLAGRDTLIVLPTGGGKSLCYQVPALVRQGLTVVISPLISLMKDQVDALERRGVPAAFINSTLGVSDVADRLARARRGELQLLYLAPERMDAGRTIDQLRDIGVALLAIDEAHCISEWGHDFRPSYRRIGIIRRGIGNPQTVALTATATPDVRVDIQRQLRLRNAVVVVGGFDRTNLSYHVLKTRTQREKDKAAVTAIRAQPGAVVVYTPTRKAVERVTQMLTRARISAVAYHAGLDETHRRRAQEEFMQSRARVIVATSAFGMGIDKPDVRLVVHHAMPGSLEAYYQEAGRAGRDGKHSECILLHTYPDRMTHEYFIRGSHPERKAVEQLWTLLRAEADSNNFVSLTLEELQARARKSINERHVGSALRVLAQNECLSVEPPSLNRIFIRLLATPARITNELSAQQPDALQLLRSMWRLSGARLADGASIDLDDLPPSSGGTPNLTPILNRLESEQFIIWARTGGGFRLSPKALSSPKLPVNWSRLAERRAVDMSRLSAMEQYAQTRGCRRAFVLRYFGDSYRSNCGACDRCLQAQTRKSTGIHAPKGQVR